MDHIFRDRHIPSRELDGLKKSAPLGLILATRWEKDGLDMDFLPPLPQWYLSVLDGSESHIHQAISLMPLNGRPLFWATSLTFSP